MTHITARLYSLRKQRLMPGIPWLTLLEVALIAAWALWVGRNVLNFDRTMMLTGREFGMSIQSHFVWQWFSQCNLCVFWDGSINGGAPAFTELQGAVLHPAVVVTSLLFGAINGAKVTLIITLFIAGFAQWWLARVMQLSLLPRLWVAAMAVVAGNLSGRMESGLLAESLSTAACALTLAPGLKLALTGERRAAILFAITLALAIVAGQGYLQAGLLFGLLPVYIIFLFDSRGHVRPVWKEFLLAGVLALLLAGLLLVPLGHFWPNFVKGSDADFSSAQALEYAPLNLVIRDLSFYTNDSLAKWATPHMYVNFIGWIPIILAVIALRLVPREKMRMLIYFLAATGWVLLTSSAVTFRLLAPQIGFISSIRYASVIGGLAVPLVLALAGWGLHLLLQLNWPRIALWLPGFDGSQTARSFRIHYLVLAIPLLWSIEAAYTFSSTWLKLEQTNRDVYVALQTVKQPSTQWVELIYGEQFWTPAALDAGMKLAKSIRPWDWLGRDLPEPYMKGTRDINEIDTSSPNYLGESGGIYLVSHPENLYAYINAGEQKMPCQATALGGNIDVECTSEVAGKLIVTENSWDGWYASRDGTPIPLENNRWLTVDAPAGTSHYEFRYRPWDVALGFLLTLIGIILCVWWWFRSPGARPAAAEPPPSSETAPTSESTSE
jgi:hypothetical protein